MKLRQTIRTRLQPQIKTQTQNYMELHGYVCSAINVVGFLYRALHHALLVTGFSPCAGTESQFNTGVKIEQQMHPSGEKILCLCKTWIFAYSHTTPLHSQLHIR